MSLDGIVLAGGPGTRLGVPKAGVMLGGLTLVERAVAILSRRCDRVVVVSRPEVVLSPLAAEVILDRAGPDCPLTAVATGLAAVEAQRVVVLGCDLPFAGPALDALLATDAEGAVVAAAAGRLQPLCALYPRVAALAVAEELLAAGRLRATGLPEVLGAVIVSDCWDALMNLNTPADLARAEARLRLDTRRER